MSSLPHTLCSSSMVVVTRLFFLTREEHAGHRSYSLTYGLHLIYKKKLPCSQSSPFLILVLEAILLHHWLESPFGEKGTVSSGLSTLPSWSISWLNLPDRESTASVGQHAESPKHSTLIQLICTA